MTPRHEKLLRQRTLLREHLQWLEDEIADEQARAATTPRTEARPAEEPVPVAPAANLSPRNPPVAPASPAAEAGPPPPPTAGAPPDELLPEPAVHDIHREVRSGCMLYFGLASAVVLVVVAIVYFVY